MTLPDSAAIENPVAGLAADSTTVIDSIILTDTAKVSNQVIEPAADTTEARNVSPAPPTLNHARLLLVDDTFNIESFEEQMADFGLDDNDYYEKPSVLLDDNSPSGFGFIFPGGIFTTFGVFFLSSLLDVRTSSPATEELDGTIVAGSLLTAWSIASFTIGMHQLRRHHRLDNRYMLHEYHNIPSRPRSIETAPVVIRRGSKGVTSP